MNSTKKYSLGFLLTKVGRKATKEYASLLEPLGITPLQGGILMSLKSNKNLNQSELMEILIIDKATVYQMLKQLQILGYITLGKNSKDKRNLQILLNPSGLILCKKIETIDRILSTSFERIIGNDVESLKLNLQKIYLHKKSSQEK